MRKITAILACVVAGLAGAGRLQGMQAGGQAFLPAGMTGVYAEGAMGDTPDAKLYADGTKAIRENRWVDAEKIFDRVAQEKGPHAAGALYWMAYAESKQGDTTKAMSSCAALREQFVGSTWIDDCGALEIEIKAKNGVTVQPKPGESDELKLLALVTLMQKDPTRARAQIEEIVQSDSSEKLKEGALFILGQAVPEATYPEIVRVSYLEGDVRVARATENEKSKNPVWETAVMNLPIEAGDSLVTGKDGRAEIELEDASTIYLAENSVLNFADLHTTSGVPHTELALVSGALTTHIDSLMPGERFVLHTPTNEVVTQYPHHSEMRVNSFMDGMAVTSMGGGLLKVPDNCDRSNAFAFCPEATKDGKEGMEAGKTYFFGADHHLTYAEMGKVGDFTAFDAWVADRSAARTSATADVMKEAGLTTPVPGLAEMKGKGHFFPCPPYGTCWAPDEARSNAVLAAAPTPPPTPKSAPPASGGATAGSTGLYPMGFFPCMSGAMMNYYSGNPYLAQMYMNGMMAGSYDPYAWAICHSGWWIPNQYGYGGGGGYVWVAGRKLHHRPPVRWVKTGRTVAFVPLHPKDVKGQPPVNRELGFSPVKGKDGFRLNPIRLNPGRPVEVMKSAPKGFRDLPEPILARAQTPHMEARALRGDVKAGIPAMKPVPLTFNRNQGFMAPHQVVQGGRTVVVNAPVGRALGGAYGGAGSSGRSGSVGIGAVGGARGGAGFGSGGSMRGGGSSGSSGSSGGGGMRGGGSASATSTSASAPASSAAAGGSSHK
ncbi:MAG TPA: FecR domain-containing protein [Terracidiphilus sp.]|jgi:hypothetical protein|nr:FecR domain-containing protein [Terracidiphilus sp.]